LFSRSIAYRDKKVVGVFVCVFRAPLQSILVQVVKEISTKVQELVLKLSLAGRFIVLFPFSDRVSISQKIEDEKRRQTKKTCTIHQTKRIWCYCSHSSRRQNTAELEKTCRTC
jgi:ribonuclease G